jgi:MGT family glycosyltransferase
VARFLFCPVPQIGAVFPSVPVALELRSRGHDVAYVINPELEPILTDQSIRCFVVPHGVYGPSRPRRTSFPTAGSQTTGFHQYLLGPLPSQLESLDRIVADFAPGVLVDGVLPLAPRVLSELRGIPNASIATAVFPIPTRDALFPYGDGHLPPTTEFDRSLARLAQLVQQERLHDEVIAWNEARVSFGLCAVTEHPWLSASSPFLVILPWAPAFEYPRTDLPSQFWFVGPLVWQAKLDGLAASVASLEKTTPIVFVSQGTVFNRDPVVVKLALQALAHEPVQVVATVCRPFHPSEFEPVPPNAILARYVPFSALADQVALVVTHAGPGTVHAALSAGIPVIVLPLAVDQFEVAARCVYSGAGIRLDPATCTPEMLRAAARTVLDEPRYRANAGRLQREYARMGGPRQAATLLEQLAATGQPVLRAADSGRPERLVS